MKLKICGSLFLSLLLFSLSSSPAYTWKWALIGDTRSGHSTHEKNIAGIINKMPNNTRITVLNTGDVTADGNASQWQTWQGIVAPLGIDWNKTDPPGYIASVGNHDTHDSGWQDRWAQNLPAQVGLSAYPDITAHSQGLFGSVKYDNTIFIWVDSDSRPSGQESFLEQTLIRASQDSQATWKFVFFHHPPIPCGSKSDWSTGKGWHDNYFIPYGVDIVFLGHAHYYERTCPFTSASSKTCQSAYRGNNIVGDPDPIHIVSGGSGAGIYSTANCAWLESKAEKHHFLEVNIQGNVLNIKAWDTDSGSATNPVLIDDFTIQKGPGDPTSTPVPTGEPPTPTPTETATPPPGPKDPDLNGDGKVNHEDMKQLLAVWGPISSSAPQDLDSNGKINSFDAGLITASWTGD